MGAGGFAQVEVRLKFLNMLSAILLYHLIRLCTLSVCKSYSCSCSQTLIMIFVTVMSQQQPANRNPAHTSHVTSAVTASDAQAYSDLNTFSLLELSYSVEPRPIAIQSGHSCGVT